MSRRLFLLFSAALFFTDALQAQSPAPSPSATASPTPAPSPTTEEIVGKMAPADLQQAIQLLKSNYINPEALSEVELNRAMLLGVVERLGPGALVLAERATQPNETSAPFFGEVLEGHVAYLRFGALTPANLQALDAFWGTLQAKKIDAVVVDLRASATTNDFALAAEFAKRFVARGKPLFTLRKSSAKQERTFANEREPLFQGLLLVLADEETAGPAEAIAGISRLYSKALVIGQPTAGQAVEYADLPMSGGRILRVAVAEAILPDGRSLFPRGVAPDLAVQMLAADKRTVFEQSREKGIAPFIFENERPHLNEAALLAGRNPEIEAMEAAQRRRNEKPKTLDPVLQRAIDVITSLAIYQQK